MQASNKYTAKSRAHKANVSDNDYFQQLKQLDFTRLHFAIKYLNIITFKRKEFPNAAAANHTHLVNRLIAQAAASSSLEGEKFSVQRSKIFRISNQIKVSRTRRSAQNDLITLAADKHHSIYGQVEGGVEVQVEVKGRRRRLSKVKSP